MFVRIDPGLRSRRVIAHVKAGLICSSGESSNWTRQQFVFDFKTISSGCIAMQASAELKKRSENARTIEGMRPSPLLGSFLVGTRPIKPVLSPLPRGGRVEDHILHRHYGGSARIRAPAGERLPRPPATTYMTPCAALWCHKPGQ